MNYLLDTSTCVDAIKGRVPGVRKRFAVALRSGEHVHVPSVVAFELWYGVAKSNLPDANAALVRTFLSGVTGILAFEEEDAQVAGRVRARVEKVGRPIGAYDLLIASQALRLRMTLVTANVREFSRIKGLVWEDWSRP